MEVEMNSNDLELTLEKGFDRDQLLDETIRFFKSEFSLAASDRNQKITDGIEQLRKFKKERFEFDNLEFYPLTEEELSNAKLPQNHLDYYNFFKLEIPLTLFADGGYAFTYLRCNIEFDRGEKQSKYPPIIYDVFPSQAWQTLLNVECDLQIGLDANLKFKAGEVNSKIKFIIQPIKLAIYRPKVEADWGNGECDWRLEGRKCIKEEKLRLFIMLKIAKKRQTPLNVSGYAIARHKFQLLSAKVIEEIIPHFKDAIKFYEAGAPIAHERVWEDILNRP